MRTDVKVGLIFLFIVAAGVVSYFALTANSRRQPVDASAGPAPAVAEATPGNAVGSGLLITPPAPASASSPSVTSPESGSVFGTSSAYGAASPPPATVPGSGSIIPGSGGRPLPLGGATSVPAYGTTMAGSPYTTPVSPTHNPGPTSLIIEGPPATTSSGFGTDLSLPGTHAPGTPGFTSGLPGSFSSSLTPTLGGSEYTIVKGDTFGKIAQANHTTIKAIQAANPGVSSNKLKIGQKIKLPSAGAATSSLSPFETPVTPATPPTATRPSRSATTHPASALVGTTYTVKSGDSLRKIAKAAYGNESLWRLIWRANRQKLDDPNDIAPGMALKIPTR